MRTWEDLNKTERDREAGAVDRNTGAYAWATKAARRIANLNGVRPHIQQDGSGNDLFEYMVASMARMIHGEYDASVIEATTTATTTEQLDKLIAELAAENVPGITTVTSAHRSDGGS